MRTTGQHEDDIRLDTTRCTRGDKVWQAGASVVEGLQACWATHPLATSRSEGRCSPGSRGSPSCASCTRQACAGHAAGQLGGTSTHAGGWRRLEGRGAGNRGAAAARSRAHEGHGDDLADLLRHLLGVCVHRVQMAAHLLAVQQRNGRGTGSRACSLLGCSSSAVQHATQGSMQRRAAPWTHTAPVHSGGGGFFFTTTTTGFFFTTTTGGAAGLQRVQVEPERDLSGQSCRSVACLAAHACQNVHAAAPTGPPTYLGCTFTFFTGIFFTGTASARAAADAFASAAAAPRARAAAAASASASAEPWAARAEASALAAAEASLPAASAWALAAALASAALESSLRWRPVAGRCWRWEWRQEAGERGGATGSRRASPYRL